jgi:putative transposase
MIVADEKISVRKQAKILNIHRSNLYYHVRVRPSESVLANEIRDIWYEEPAGGYRKITALLKRRGYEINHKRVLRIMQETNIKALYPKPHTSIADKEHKKYPYLLLNLVIERPNQVWATDITYVRVSDSWMYVVAIIDVYSRYVLEWGVSNTLETDFCLAALRRALFRGKPGILNTDQGCQFTSLTWIACVEECGIKVSMDGVGRWADNIYVERFWRTLKYEHVLLHAFNSVVELKQSLRKFIAHYNNKRLHQSLRYNTPYEVYTALAHAPDACHTRKRKVILKKVGSPPVIPPRGEVLSEARGCEQSPREFLIAGGVR